MRSHLDMMESYSETPFAARTLPFATQGGCASREWNYRDRAV
jgi:hypothetical protein